MKQNANKQQKAKEEKHKEAATATNCVSLYQCVRVCMFMCTRRAWLNVCVCVSELSACVGSGVCECGGRKIKLKRPLCQTNCS